ncbi:GNAT family N-acetyltransferase [Gracilibacillus sp. S3-1-1]|uniref:GNAT family N-acetyltransferase n=1 Tax=Gracilibacillus pellucidus TaxID=3095368 RepID=A0ACC6M7J0_9BACI|nr:GNAT family N-acetyltransferase [Gracilibacillus sp. S3-1-1]MDX8046861.1 GNAT family N-acetyltransferase [Gracilibacillus sp. S3-1-1]
MKIRKLTEDEHAPMDLLLLADPSTSLVEEYLSKGTCYIAELENTVVGVYILLPISVQTIELVNVVVAESHQGKGSGKQLVLHAIQSAKQNGYKSIEVGTGNSSIDQLALYQKCGFEITEIDKDFFVKHYDEVIIENGIQCRDMMRLTQDLIEENMSYLRKGTITQQKAYVAIKKLGVMDDFKAHNPTLCGTIPIDIATADSDLDIVMEVNNLERFEQRLLSLYRHLDSFTLKSTKIRGNHVVKANFFYQGFEFELFAQSQPVTKQYAYLHMLIEYNILQEMPELKKDIVLLKQQGLKTEQAFCNVLHLAGEDPYEALLAYGRERGWID